MQASLFSHAHKQLLKLSRVLERLFFLTRPPHPLLCWLHLARISSLDLWRPPCRFSQRSGPVLGLHSCALTRDLRITLTFACVTGRWQLSSVLLRQYFAAGPSAGSRILHVPALVPAPVILTVPADSTVPYCGIGITRTVRLPAAHQSLSHCIPD